jgi:hypothetical protein
MKEAYYVDIDCNSCTLCKDNIIHLADECYSVSFMEDVTGKIVRFWFEYKGNAEVFAKLYKLHHTGGNSNARQDSKPKQK